MAPDAALQAALEQAHAAWLAAWISAGGVLVGAAVAWIAVTGSTRDRLMDRLSLQLRERQLKTAAARTGRRALVGVLLARRFAKTALTGEIGAEAFRRAAGHKRRMAFRRQAVHHFLAQEMIDPILVSWLLETTAIMEEAHHAFAASHEAEALRRAMGAFLAETAELEKRRKTIRDNLEREETAAGDEIEALEATLRRLQTWGWLWPYRYVGGRPQLAGSSDPDAD